MISLLPDYSESHNQMTDKEELLASSFVCYIISVPHLSKS